MNDKITLKKIELCLFCNDKITLKRQRHYCSPECYQQSQINYSLKYEKDNVKELNDYKRKWMKKKRDQFRQKGIFNYKTNWRFKRWEEILALQKNGKNNL